MQRPKPSLVNRLIQAFRTGPLAVARSTAFADAAILRP